MANTAKSMTSHYKHAAGLLSLALATCVSCSGGSVGSVAGTVTVDGAPVDVGTISFRSVDDGGKGVAGGAIQGGQFQAASRDTLAPGKYTVQVQATKKTGRTIKDPQRGNVDELVPVAIADSPKEIEISNETAGNLALEFASQKK
jgi:hypothetical protein